MLISISILYTCIKFHNNQCKWTKKLECTLKYYLTQFDKTLTVKIYIKITYKKQYKPEPFMNILPPPPFPKNTSKQKKPLCKDIMYVKKKKNPVHRSKTWNMINDITHPYERSRSCGLT